MRTAVIIVEFNDAEETIKYVNKIKEYDIIQKIVVVDNNSTIPDTFEKIKTLENEKICVIQSDKNGGYSYGNNYGVRFLEKNEEKFDYIIISNPDIEVEENAISNCLRIMQNDEKIAITAPRMYNSSNKPIRRSSWKIRTFDLDVIHSTRLLEILFYNKLRNGEYSEKEYSEKMLQVEAISGAFFIVKSDILKEIGYFDENVFLFYEEDILAKKLKEKNYKTYSINTEKFVHYESQTIGKTFSYYKKMKQLYKSKMYYHEKYNHINIFQKLIFQILNCFRKLELFIEIPIRKILEK